MNLQSTTVQPCLHQVNLSQISLLAKSQHLESDGDVMPESSRLEKQSEKAARLRM